MTICENDLNRIPPGVANLSKLVELDVSKNGEPWHDVTSMVDCFLVGTWKVVFVWEAIDW